MPWTPLPLGPAVDVVATTTKKRIALALGPLAIRRLGWSEDEAPNVTAALGDGEHAGWLRISLDEDGVTPELNDGQLVLTLPRSALPDLQDCRGSPLVWRPLSEEFGRAIDVRLPTVAATRSPARPQLAVSNARKPAPADDLPQIEQISPPALYENLHRTAWANGVELTWLSDGNVLVNGRVQPVDDVENVVRVAVEGRNTARQRAS